MFKGHDPLPPRIHLLSKLPRGILFFLFCLIASSAHAGHYTVSYSGGTVETSSLGSEDYVQLGSGYYEGYGDDFVQGSNVNPSVICSGKITATFTWVPDNAEDTAPSSVVIAETCNAAAGLISGNSNAFSEHVDDGMGDPDVDGVSSGQRYTIQTNPGNSFAITCEPSAFASVGGSGEVEGSVDYKATATPLNLVLSGGIGAQNAKRYLIGQKATATVQNGGLTASNFKWSITGGDPFYYWMANQTTGTFDPLDLSQEHGSSTSCYFKMPGTATFTCTFDLAVPAGAKPAGGFPGIVLTKTAVIDPPDAFGFPWKTGSVAIDPPPPANPFKFGFVGLQIPRYPGTSIGISWQAFATTPANYVTAGDKGGWNYVQLITPGYSRISQGIAQTWNLNGIRCLDTRYPYTPTQVGNFPGSAGKFPADGVINVDGDGPGFILLDTLSRVQLFPKFDTWLMYLPPGSDSCYVPLRKIKWFCNGTAIRTGPGVWQQTSDPKSIGASVDGADFPPFPTWTQNYTSGRWTP